MRIECPECAARYDIPDDRLSPGRTVRCARCGHDWAPVPVAVEPAQPKEEVAGPEQVPPSGVEAVPARPRTPHPFLVPPRVAMGEAAPVTARPGPAARPARTGLAVAWLATAVVLAGAAWGAVAFRGAIVQAWPPSQRAYDALGLAVPPPGP